jgi:hypothetical protein
VPSYITSPQGVRSFLQPGIPGYSAGSFASGVANARMYVTASQVVSNVVTLFVQVVEGNIPASGATAYVTGTSNGSTTLNQPTGVTLTGVTITASTGAGTITYSETTTAFAKATDGGQVIVPTQEVGDTLATSTKYLQFSVPQPIDYPVSGRTVSWSTVVGGAPSPVTINLQGSLVDQDSQYSTLDSSSNTTGETRYITGVDLPFLRITTGTITGGTGPTLVAKILI